MYLCNFYNVVQVVIYQYTSAVFAHHYFLALFYLTLLLRRDSIVATTTGITVNRYYSQAIAVALANAVVRIQQSFIHAFAGFVSYFAIVLFFLFGFSNNLFQITFFTVQDRF